MRLNKKALLTQGKQLGLLVAGALGGAMLANTLSGIRKMNGPAVVAMGGAAAAVLVPSPALKTLSMGAVVIGLSKVIGRNVPTLAGSLEGWVDAASERLDAGSSNSPVQDIGYTIVDDSEAQLAYVPLAL